MFWFLGAALGSQNGHDKIFIVENTNLPTSEALALADRAAAGEVSIHNNKN